MSQCTPIENLKVSDDVVQSNEGDNVTTAQKVLEKYNQMEPDADTERQQVNQNMEERQMDPALVNQHRMMEMQRAREYQLQQQHIQRQQEDKPPPPKKMGFMDKIKNSFSNLGNQLKGPVLVIVLVFVLSLPFVNNLLMKFIPKISNEGVMNIKGLVLKALVAGVLFFALNMFISL